MQRLLATALAAMLLAAGSTPLAAQNLVDPYGDGQAPAQVVIAPDSTTAPKPSLAPLAVSPAEIVSGNPDKPQIALTFDGGASGIPGAKLLQILRDKGVHSTFFVTGQFARQYPPLVQQIVADGHELANHTWDHQDLTTLNDIAVIGEITRGEDVISGIAGVSTKPLFRFPYGARNQRVQNLVAGQGYRSIYWTVDSLDWMDQATVASITDRVLRGGRNGAIVLMHIGATYTNTALPNIIDTLRARGFNLMTVTEVAQ